MKNPPYFKRTQLGVILLLGVALLLLWAWRANFFLAPSPPPPRNLNGVFVEVSGDGAHPGVYAFDHVPTLAEIWPKSGAAGKAPMAPDKLASGSRVEIAADGHYLLSRMHGAELLTLGLPLDLNSASATDLDALPGIGPALAQRIVAYRGKQGPFKKIDDLQEVSGIGAKLLDKIKPQLSIAPVSETADERDECR
jgi:competence ComEA-like helix-hairpin-helix protein